MVLGAAVLVSRAPAPYRGSLRTALIVAGSLILVGLPLALGLGRRPDNPSVLPLAYGTNLVGLVAIIGLCQGAAALVAAYRGGMTRTVLTVLGVLLAIWVVITVIGAIFATLKFFLYVGLVVLVIMAVVAFIGRSAKSDR